MMYRCLIALLFITKVALAAPMEIVSSCQMVDGSRVSLLAESSIGGKQLYLKVDGKTKKAFTDMPDTDFIGQVTLAKCVNNVLIFALNYGSPYIKGSAVRKNPINHATEQLNFAEKALPRWLYLSPTEMRLVIPNIGYEVSAKYLIYRFVVGKGQENQAVDSNTLPGKQGFTVRRVK